jgi:hypothetical protein
MARKLAPQQAKGGRRILPPEDYSSWKVAFTFHETQPDFGVLDLLDSEKAKFLDAMNTRSTMTWRQMRADPHGLGSHDVTKARFKVTIPPCLRGRQVLAIKCSKGMRRLIGHQVQATFSVVWFDSDGRVYDHGD